MGKLKALLAIVATMSALAGFSNTEFLADVTEVFATCPSEARDSAIEASIKQLEHQLSYLQKDGMSPYGEGRNCNNF